MNELARIQDFTSVIDSLVTSINVPNTRRAYQRHITDFIDWYVAKGHPRLNKLVVSQYVTYLTARTLSAASINQALAAIRWLARELEDSGKLDSVLASGIQRAKGVRSEGKRTGNWLSKKDAQKVLRAPDTSLLLGLRDRALLSIFIGSGLRRSEAAALTFDHIQQRNSRWVLVDITGKRNKLRTVPIASWVHQSIVEYADKAGISSGYVFRPILKGGYKLNGDSMTPQAVRDAVMKYLPDGITPHDLRRTFAKLARSGSAELTQIQLSLGHSSVKTTQDYVGEDLDLTSAPSDMLGLKLL